MLLKAKSGLFNFLIISTALILAIVGILIFGNNGTINSKDTNIVNRALETFNHIDKNHQNEFYPNTDWFPITEDTDGNIYAISLSNLPQDTNSTEKKFWIESYSSGSVKNKILLQIDCKDLTTYGIIARYDYGQEGNLINSYDIYTPPNIGIPIPQAMPPDSIYAYASNIACYPKEEIKNIAKDFSKEVSK